MSTRQPFSEIGSPTGSPVASVKVKLFGQAQTSLTWLTPAPGTGAWRD